MSKIIVLDEFTSNRIAAGEVIERPASVVKELVENSIDAGAQSISVEIRNGGISYIRVTDNGSGIEADDVELAFERHATSKIRYPEDLNSISTLGFRGEALASIAAVSRVQLATRARGKPYGTSIAISGGVVEEIKSVGCPEGSSFTVRDLFFNTPARYKFLKKDSVEAGYVSDVIIRAALGNPNISFKLVNNGSTVIHTPGNSDLKSTIFSLYGSETAKKCVEISFRDDKVIITGYAGLPEIARSNRNYQSIFVNGRYIKSKLITSAIEDAYSTLVMKHKYPFIVLKLEINPQLVDVNVHPTKMEVRFSDEKHISSSVYNAVSSAVLFHGKAKDFQLKKPVSPDVQYEQQKMDIQRHVEHLSEEENSSHSLLCDEKPENRNKIQEYDNNTNVKAQPISSPGLFSPDVRIVGQVFLTYVILQENDDMVLIDQHAAHERILFEKLVQKYDRYESLSQGLITPVVVELTPQEMCFIADKKDFFCRLGFEIEEFGNNSIVIRAVPYTDSSVDVKSAFMELLDEVMNWKEAENRSLVDKSLYTIACKSAVKANRKLDEAEIKILLHELNKLVNPFTCPHGRPIVLRLKKSEIEREFKRIL